jgi:hypothetical protein
LYVGKEPVTFEHEGAPVFIGPHIVVRAGHPIMEGREGLFTPLVVHYDVAEPAKDVAAKPARTAPPKR